MQICVFIISFTFCWINCKLSHLSLLISLIPLYFSFSVPSMLPPYTTFHHYFHTSTLHIFLFFTSLPPTYLHIVIPPILTPLLSLFLCISIIPVSFYLPSKTLLLFFSFVSTIVCLFFLHFFSFKFFFLSLLFIETIFLLPFALLFLRVFFPHYFLFFYFPLPSISSLTS